MLKVRPASLDDAHSASRIKSIQDRREVLPVVVILRLTLKRQTEYGPKPKAQRHRDGRRTIRGLLGRDLLLICFEHGAKPLGDHV